MKYSENKNEQIRGVHVRGYEGLAPPPEISDLQQLFSLYFGGIRLGYDNCWADHCG